MNQEELIENACDEWINEIEEQFIETSSADSSWENYFGETYYCLTGDLPVKVDDIFFILLELWYSHKEEPVMYKLNKNLSFFWWSGTTYYSTDQNLVKRFVKYTKILLNKDMSDDFLNNGADSDELYNFDMLRLRLFNPEEFQRYMGYDF